MTKQIQNIPQNKSADTRRISDLRSHDLNVRIYNDEPDAELVESVRIFGILEPIQITHNNRIVSGHRRVHAASIVGLEEVPVIVINSDDELEIEEILIHANKHRPKTNEQLARECQNLLRIEEIKAKRRQATGGKGVLGGKPLPAILPEGVEARAAVAKVLGIGSKKAVKAAYVADSIDALKDAGKYDKAHDLRKELNSKSVETAYRTAKALSPQGGIISPNDYEAAILLSAWEKMTPEEKAAILSASRKSLTFNEQTGDSIDWAKYSWNPISGCLHDCKYCYAREVADSFYDHGFVPALYPDRLDTPQHMKLSPKASQDVSYCNVFTVSMGDLFGKWVPREWIEAVLQSVRNAPNWNFLLLTKYPERLLEFDFPVNAWVGTTVDTQARVQHAEAVFAQLKASVKWLSCEPMQERLTFTNLSLFQWLVIGGASETANSPKFSPPRDWVNHLWTQADAAGVKVFEKKNLLERRREFPVQPIVT